MPVNGASIAWLEAIRSAKCMVNRGRPPHASHQQQQQHYVPRAAHLHNATITTPVQEIQHKVRPESFLHRRPNARHPSKSSGQLELGRPRNVNLKGSMLVVVRRRSHRRRRGSKKPSTTRTPARQSVHRLPAAPPAPLTRAERTEPVLRNQNDGVAITNTGLPSLHRGILCLLARPTAALTPARASPRLCASGLR